MAHILQLNSTQLNSTQLNSTIIPFLQKLIPPVPPLKTCPRMLLSGKGPACADRDSGGFACFAIKLFINAFSGIFLGKAFLFMR